MMDSTWTDEAVLAELGARLAQRRLALRLTQAELANQAGVGKRTVERIEAGHSAQLTSLIRLLRVLQLMPALHALVPESSARPMDLLKQQARLPQRVRKRADEERPSDGEPWSWGEPE